MNGNNISLARENTAPISRQTYEVLSGFWSTYRDYQTEDFFISIDIEKIQFSEDIGVNSILNVTNGIVQVEISNYGLNDANAFNVAYSVDGAAPVIENITSTLLSANSMNYIFSTPFTSPLAQVEICSWTEYPVDMQQNNDSTCIITTISVIDESLQPNTKKLLRVTDLLGQKTPFRKNTPLFYIYDNGTVEKKIIID